MRLAAITMVYQSHDMLRRWYEHHDELVGFENLYIVSHGNDDAHRSLAPKANFLGIPRTGLERFETNRNKALNGLIRFLEFYYDVVIRTDVDEFLFVDPDHHNSLEDAFFGTDLNAWFAVGFDVFAEPGDEPVPHEKRISETRSLCCVSALYSKAVAVRRGIVLAYHGARDPINNDDRHFALPVGLYLAHARHANTLEVDGTIAGNHSGLGSSDERAELYARHVQGLPEQEANTELNSAFADFSKGFGRWKRKRPRFYVVPRRQAKVSFRIPDRFVGRF